MIKRSSQKPLIGGSLQDMLMVYTLQIRYLAEKACPAWNGNSTVKNSNILESIQKSALKIILGFLGNFLTAMRVSLAERLYLRHISVLCLGIILGLYFVDDKITDMKVFLEFKTDAYKKLNFTGFNNTYGQEGPNLIPNFIHYIRLNQTKLQFFEAVCMKSAFMIQNPDKIFIHTDNTHLSGKYWDSLFQIPGFKSRLEVKKVIMPVKVYGVEFYWNAHKADLLRLLILRRYGGIYLDNDIYVVNKLDRYLQYEYVLGWPEGEWIGNMIMMANKDARFITEFLNTYKLFRPDIWYYNGGEKPVREILYRFPELIHNVPYRLGVTTNTAWFFYAMEGRWDPNEWQEDYDTIHLLIGHREDIDPNYNVTPEFTEENVRWLDTNVPMMLRYMWYGSIEAISDGPVDMDKVNKDWIKSQGSHQLHKFIQEGTL